MDLITIISVGGWVFGLIAALVGYALNNSKKKQIREVKQASDSYKQRAETAESNINDLSYIDHVKDETRGKSNAIKKEIIDSGKPGRVPLGRLHINQDSNKDN